MTQVRNWVCGIAMALLPGLVGSPVAAADLTPPSAVERPVVAPSWTFRFTPYAWLTSLNGTQTVKGRTAKVNASFIDVVDATWGQGGTLVGLMADVEARNGPFSLFGDLVWAKIGLGSSGVRTRSFSPAISGSIGAAVDVKYNMAIVEAGAAYEVARLGAASFDVLAGGRYWSQRAEVALNLSTTVDIGDLSLGRDRAIARSGSINWFDGFAGARARVTVAPGQEIFLRGDLGGGGSKFTWQAIAGYNFEFARKNGVTYSGIVGYKALYADYTKGEGRNRFEFDMLQHGPVIALSMQF